MRPRPPVPALAALAVLGLLAGACASRPAVLPAPVDAAALPRPERAPEPPPPPAPANPRLPPTPEIVALPGGRQLPPPPTQPAGPAGTPGGATQAAVSAGAARGIIPRPPGHPPPAAEAEGCLIPPGAVTVRLEMQRPEVTADRGRATLAAMTGRPPEGGMHVAGVYRATIRMRLNLRIGQLPNGCLLPYAQLTVEVPRAIFVASELSPGTCRYEVVLGHEREHARIDDVLMADLDGWMAAPVRRVLTEPGAMRTTQADLAARLHARFEQAREAFRQARQQAQLSIDTPEEYARASRACG